MLKAYVAISAIIFALVAIIHLIRIAQGWLVQLGDIGVDVSLMDRARYERWNCYMGRHVTAAVRETAMLRKRKEPKRKSIAMTLMRDIQGSAAEKLAMFEKVRAAGGFSDEDPADLAEAEKMLRAFAAMEKGSR